MFSKPTCPMPVQIQLLTEQFFLFPALAGHLEKLQRWWLHTVRLWDTPGWGSAWAPPHLGTCHPAGLGGQVFGIVQSSLEADVVPPQLGEPAVAVNKAPERPGYHEYSPTLAPTLDPPPNKPALQGPRHWKPKAWPITAPPAPVPALSRESLDP